MSTPYADSAMDYLSKGWSPIPVGYDERGRLHQARKHRPPIGWTGYVGHRPSGADVADWAANGAGVANIGLRLPETILGIDVDNYDGKPGLVTMLAAVERLGPLPMTYVSTSRPDDEISGIRVYRVPPGRRWADQLGAGVELVHHGHRYVVAAPSMHPEGRVYRWRSPEGAWLDQPPTVADPPLLPDAWVADLDRGDISERSQKAGVRAADVQQYLAQMPPGTPCTYVTRLLDQAAEELAPAASRHDSVRDYIGRMVRAGDQGHRGAATGLDTLESVWQQALHRGKPREPDAGEWERMVTGAVALVIASPTSPMDKGCCPPEPVLLTRDPGVLLTRDPGVLLGEEHGVLHQDTSLNEAPDYAATMALEVERAAYKIRVRDAAREKVAAEMAVAVDLPATTQLDAFLAVPDEECVYRVDRLWPVGGRVVLAAQHKAGKSTLVANLIRALVDAEAFLDTFGVAPVARVVIIDDELDERMLRRWLRDQGIRNTDQVTVVPLRGRLSSFNVLDAATRTRWAEHLGPADVLLLDCLRPALDALGLSEDKEAGRFLEALDELAAEAGIPELAVVHHMGHQGERSRGDSRILDWPDAVWRLVKDAEDEETGAGQVRRYLTAYGRDVDVPESLLAFDPATRRLSVAGGTRSDRKAGAASADVVASMADYGGPLSGRAIEERMAGTEHPQKSVRAAVRRLADAGQLVKEGRPGRGGGFLYSLSASSALEVRQRGSEKCVSASIDAQRTHYADDELDQVSQRRTSPGEDTEAPIPGRAGETLLLRAAACLVCGSDGGKPGLGASGYCVPCEIEAGK